MTSKQREPLIIHHAGCSDGVCGAMVIWLELNGRGDLLAAKYGDEPPGDRDIEDRDVWIVDFSYPRDVLTHINELANSLRVFDHHETAMANCEGLDFCHFDMGECGASLVFEYILRRETSCRRFDNLIGQKLTELIAYVEDRDLWKWELPDSREVNAYLRSWPQTLEAWLWILETGIGVREVESGKAILRREEQLVENMCSNAIHCYLDYDLVQLVNAPVMQSEVAERLRQHTDADYIVAWHYVGNNVFKYSLRAPIGNPPNLAKIAEGYGGGGHAKAAGFRSNSGPEELFDGFKRIKWTFELESRYSNRQD